MTIFYQFLSIKIKMTDRIQFTKINDNSPFYDLN